MYHPLPEEIFATGVVSVCILSGVVMASLYNIWTAKSSMSCYVSTAILITSALDITFYSFLIVTNSTDSVIGFSFRILSSLFFFLALMIVANYWVGLLAIRGCSRHIFNRKSMLLVSVSLSAMDLFSYSRCLEAHTTTEFSATNAFRLYALVDILQNVFYSCSLLCFAVRLIKRFNSHTEDCFQDNESTMHLQKRLIAFKNALSRFSIAISIVSVSNVMRCTMFFILLTMYSLSGSRVTTPYFSLNGIMWCLLIDVIPLAASAMALLILVNPACKRKLVKSRQCNDLFDNDDFHEAMLGSPLPGGDTACPLRSGRRPQHSYSHLGASDSTLDDNNDVNVSFASSDHGNAGLYDDTARDSIQSKCGNICTGNNHNNNITSSTASWHSQHQQQQQSLSHATGSKKEAPSDTNKQVTWGPIWPDLLRILDEQEVPAEIKEILCVVDGESCQDSATAPLTINFNVNA